METTTTGKFKDGADNMAAIVRDFIQSRFNVRTVEN
jgi:hypothetical protein